MRIKWYGQSSFLLTSESGSTILIDPYGKFLGYRMPTVKADIVTVTHNHRDHNQVYVVEGEYALVNEPRHYPFEQADIRGIPTFHDNENGSKRGENIVFVFDFDRLRLCHCGDLGHLLTPEQAAEVGKIDILFTPVGGTRTLDGVLAAELVRQLQPSIVIPMHYRTEALGFAGKVLFKKVDVFIREAGLPVTETPELDVTSETIDRYRGVVILEY